MATSFAIRIAPMVLATLAIGLPAQASGLPAQVPEQAPGAELPAVFDDRLEVKLAEGSGAELKNGRLISRTGTDLTSVQRWFDQARVQPLITVMSWDELDQLHRDVCAKLPEHNRPGHLGLWFRLHAEDAAAAELLRSRLAEEPLIAHVYHEPRFYPASHTVPTQGGDPAPPTPSFTAMQVAHGPGPIGHGIRLAAGVLGARGQGVGMRMIETGWLFGHEDVCQLVDTNIIGPVPPYVQSTSLHGLSGASIVIADRNEWGVTGIADEVEAKFLSMELNGGLGNSMLLAMTNSQPGDVTMIVIMALIPGLGPGSWLPIEFYQSVFDATLSLTATGRHVVVPAGNGDRSLDDPALLGRFDRGLRDSGAVIAGASDGDQLVKAPFSNWGARIDGHSHGDGVVSCGYGSLWIPPGGTDMQQSYTAAATGTSSSTPHLAGIIMMIQGAAKWQLGQTLSNQQVVDLLNTHGPTTPDVIGRRSDVAAIFETLGIFDGLRLIEPDVVLGQTITVQMEGPDMSLVALFGAFGTVNLPVGLNRNLHLDPGSLGNVGAYLISGGPAQFLLPVPMTASLHGADIFFQAVRLDGSNPLHLTNSCQATIL